MVKWNSCIVAIVVVSLLGLSAAAGQGTVAEKPAPTAPAAPPAGDVLKHVPAGCMGFVVVNNVQKFAGKIDGFLKQISPPEQPLVPGNVLDMIRGAAQLGEGFNPNGGFAVVMLDPQQYGLDLVSMIAGPAKPPAPGEEVKKQPPPPVVLLVPTTDKTMADMLAAYEPVKEGNYIKLGRPGRTPTYCMVAGNYALIGPNLKAVQTVAGGGKSVMTQLSATDKALVARNDVAVWVNFKMLAPIIEAAITRMEKELAADHGPMTPTSPAMMMKSMGPSLSSIKEMLNQIEDLSAGLRIGPAGIMIDGRCSWLPDSMMGKALAAYKPKAGSLLNRLPNMPYVLAFGGRNEPKTTEWNIKYINQIFDIEPFKGLSAESKAKLRDVILSLEDQIEAVQFYLGGITTGTGQVGAAYVLQCKSAEKAKAMLADGVAVANELIQTSKEEEIKKLTIKYHKALEAVGDVKVDVISIDHPEITSMDEDDRGKMKAVLGEDKFRLLIASADEKTLVITLGGGTAFLAEAMKTAKGTGTLHKDPAVAKALAMLPKERIAVGLLNVGNIFKIIKNVAVAIGEEPPPMPPIDADEPLAGAVSIEGSDVSFVGYLPTKTIGEAVKAFMGMMGRAAGPPPGAGQDF